MMKALYPGSFDPPTNGHLNIIQRAARIFDRLEVVIATNPRKQYFFDAEERYRMLGELLQPYENVGVVLWDKLIVDYARKAGAKVIVRGVRALADFEYEFELSMMNRGLDPGVETIFIPTDPKYFVLRSSAIKELAMLDGEIASMVPPNVAEALRRKVRGS